MNAIVDALSKWSSRAHNCSSSKGRYDQWADIKLSSGNARCISIEPFGVLRLRLSLHLNFVVALNCREEVPHKKAAH